MLRTFFFRARMLSCNGGILKFVKIKFNHQNVIAKICHAKPALASHSLLEAKPHGVVGAVFQSSFVCHVHWVQEHTFGWSGHKARLVSLGTQSHQSRPHAAERRQASSYAASALVALVLGSPLARKCRGGPAKPIFQLLPFQVGHLRLHS